MNLRSTFLNYIVIVLALLISNSILANIINVPGDHSTIQAAIVASSTGDTILVQAGTYNGLVNFNGKAITVGSLFLTTQNEAHIATTIINGSGSTSCVKFNSGETSTSVLTGFTVTNGYAYYGAGIYCISGSSPTLSYLDIENNNGHPGDSYGGALCCLDSSNPTCSNLTMSGNYAEAGGAVYCHNNSEPSFNDCIFNDNNANHGGAILTSYSHPQFYYCAIYENTANSAGAGVYASFHSHPDFTNCTVVDNTTPGWGGGFYCNDIYGEPNILNCIVWGNSSDYNLQIFATVANPVVTYTDVQDGTGESWFGTGCIDTDPLFTDPANDDYTLTDSSPCIDAGDPASPSDPDGSNADMGAYPNYVTFSADYFADYTEVCEGSTVQFTDASLGSPTSWNWTFEGGTPPTSTDQNPTVVYNTAGVYDVTLDIADGSYSSTLLKENYINVSTAVAQATTPTGETDVCAGTQQEYTTMSIAGATSYDWVVDPADAGTIIGNDAIGTFDADNTWTGNYIVKVRATNSCGNGAWSGDLSCSLSLNPYTFQLSEGGGYCESGSGIEITQDGSEVNVNYELFLESVSTGIIIPGTGNALTFGVQTEQGLYTVVGSAGNCVENMVGTPYIFITTIPSPGSIPDGSTSVCAATTTDYTVDPIGGADNTIWTLTPGEAGTIIGSGTSISIEWDTDYSGLANLTAHGENSCGHGDESDALEINCSLTPTPEITGLTLVCDEEETEYETTETVGNSYDWTVTGGEITNGAGTNQITVLWGVPGAGTVELTVTSSDNCEAGAETQNVTIDDCIGIEEFDVGSVTVYPNPATSIVNVKSNVSIVSIKIFDLAGKELSSKLIHAKTCQLPISNLQSGIYMLIFETDNGICRERLIIE
jgi:PKD repeat protein